MEVSERFEEERGGGASDVRLAAPVHALVTVGDVKEEVLLVMLLRRTRR